MCIVICSSLECCLCGASTRSRSRTVTSRSSAAQRKRLAVSIRSRSRRHRNPLVPGIDESWMSCQSCAYSQQSSQLCSYLSALVTDRSSGHSAAPPSLTDTDRRRADPTVHCIATAAAAAAVAAVASPWRTMLLRRICSHRRHTTRTRPPRLPSPSTSMSTQRRRPCSTRSHSQSKVGRGCTQLLQNRAIESRHCTPFASLFLIAVRCATLLPVCVGAALPCFSDAPPFSLLCAAVATGMEARFVRGRWSSERTVVAAISARV